MVMFLWFKQQKFILIQFWKPEVQNEPQRLISRCWQCFFLLAIMLLLGVCLYSLVSTVNHLTVPKENFIWGNFFFFREMSFKWTKEYVVWIYYTSQLSPSLWGIFKWHNAQFRKGLGWSYPWKEHFGGSRDEHDGSKSIDFYEFLVNFLKICSNFFPKLKILYLALVLLSWNINRFT